MEFSGGIGVGWDSPERGRRELSFRRLHRRPITGAGPCVDRGYSSAVEVLRLCLSRRYSSEHGPIGQAVHHSVFEISLHMLILSMATSLGGAAA